jgi:hypothetical protein
LSETKITILQRLVREPLLHFIAIGGLFFLIYSAVNEPYDNSIEKILISPERISQIENRFSSVWNRVPTPGELDNLIEEEIRIEVYYRDALALGLDANDTIVRRRMLQKMEFLTDTSIYLQEPSEVELAKYFAENEQNYRREPRLAFEQIYLGQSPSKDTVLQILQSLQSKSAIDPSTLGRPTLLPAQLKLSQPNAIDSVFGKGFYNQIAGITPGEWGGPVTSSYGTHLVRTLDGEPGNMLSLEEVRKSVLKDWQSYKAKENRKQDYVKRRSRYSIEINGDENSGEVEKKEKS